MFSFISNMSSDEQDFVVLEDQDLQDFNEDALLPLSEEDISLIEKWLQPTEYATEGSEYRKHLNSHLSGTCSWIKESKSFKEWHESSDKGCLWIKGVPGSGKSVAAATLAAQFASQEKVPVLYFFFRRIVTANQRPQSLLRDYLSQLLKYSPGLQHELKSWIDEGRSLESISVSELWKALQSTLLLLPRVYCIADALDEMDQGNEEFLQDLVKLSQQRPGSTKVMLTSRPVPRIERSMNDKSVLQISLQAELTKEDIKTYVDHRLSSCYLSELVGSRIKSTILARANGLFLYARLVIDEALDSVRGNTQDEETLVLAFSKLPRNLAENIFSHAARALQAIRCTTGTTDDNSKMGYNIRASIASPGAREHN